MYISGYRIFANWARGVSARAFMLHNVREAGGKCSDPPPILLVLAIRAGAGPAAAWEIHSQG